MKWHGIFKEGGKVQDCEFVAPPTFEQAEKVFKAEHPNATYWELGMPLVEIEYDGTSKSQNNGDNHAS